MSFNPDPTKQAIEVLFFKKEKIGQHAPLYFNEAIVARQNTHKHLDLTLDNKSKFTHHVTDKTKMANKLLGTLKYLSKYHITLWR